MRPHQLSDEILNQVKPLLGLDRLRQLLFVFLRAKGLISEDDLIFSSWHVRNWPELDDDFFYELGRAEIYRQVCEATFLQGKELDAKSCLMHLRLIHQGMDDFFLHIKEDLARIHMDTQYDWPMIPDGHQLPETYIKTMPYLSKEVKQQLKEILNLDGLKKTMMLIAKAKGATDQSMSKPPWKLDYTKDLDEAFYEEIAPLNALLVAYEAATLAQDLLNRRFCMIQLGRLMGRLAKFFDNIEDDIAEIWWKSGFDWPDFTEDYKLSPDYFPPNFFTTY
jgi:hypothetical protein